MHTMERYFIPGISCEMTDEIAEGLLRTVIRNGRKVMENQEDYDAMAEIMWCGSLSHNNLTECGRGKDFSVHKLGHALSARYDVAHGASLASVWASWARYQYEAAPQRFAKYARKVFGIEGQDEKKLVYRELRKQKTTSAKLECQCHWKNWGFFRMMMRFANLQWMQPWEIQWNCQG